MLRLTDLKLPLEHTDEALHSAIVLRLGIAANDLLSFSVYKRSYDARKRGHILLIYSLDVSVSNEAAVLLRLTNDVHVGPSPDTTYRFVTDAPSSDFLRPIVIGFGPCGLFAALILAQMGFKPIVL